ncbi:hypothetical protein BN2537_351 [Streptomyces venezuelae]|nr:hypothetical protein BN2537_351 [Streptomyces venezuelae]
MCGHDGSTPCVGELSGALRRPMPERAQDAARRRVRRGRSDRPDRP